MLKLPSVTLVMIETLEHELARLAIDDCIRQVEFGDVLIFTDKPELFKPLDCDARFVRVPCWPNKMGWSKCSWYDVPPHVRTPQTLYIQWDAWVWDPARWRDEYLDYDIVGAPWPWHPHKRVGNLGFAIRSTRLIRYVLKNRDKFPCNTDIDDDLLCRTYRQPLEEVGFVWAPEQLAYEFAFECSLPDMERRHFGFHAAHNFKHVLPPERLRERAQMMKDSVYIGKKNSYMWQNFCKANPDVVAELQ